MGQVSVGYCKIVCLWRSDRSKPLFIFSMRVMSLHLVREKKEKKKGCAVHCAELFKHILFPCANEG
jgi:hypothetical protein